MKDSILQKFLIPLPESYSPKIDVIGHDDLEFLETIGNYMYQKKSNPKEALNGLNTLLGLHSRRSELCGELIKASKDRLNDVDSIYVKLDLSNYNDEQIGESMLDKSCTFMSPIISGTIDGTFVEQEGDRACGLYPFDPENTKLYIPVIEKWLNEYRQEHNHSLAINEFLASVSDAFRLNDGIKEVIAAHDPEVMGRITFVQ